MPIIASDSSSKLESKPIDAAVYVARCIGMCHIGTIDDTYQGNPVKRNKIRITWETPTELREFKEGDGEKPYVISNMYTLSLHENSKLKELLESWRGVKFTDEEIKGFDLTKVVGKPCMINIIHTERNGKVYADVKSVTPIAKGIQCPPQINPSSIWEYGNPDWDLFNSFPNFLKEMISNSDEFKALKKPEATTTASPVVETVHEEADVLPF